MPVNNKTFLDDMRAFTVDSMQWCAKESEGEATRIYDTLQKMMEDVNRRSSMSTNAKQAVLVLQDKIRALAKSRDQDQVAKLIEFLDKQGTDNAEVRQLFSPIVEALQFQDRLRQNLENMGSMISYWLRIRQTLVAKGALAESDMVDFGHELLKCTTSVEERDVIRSQINGLPEEVAAAVDVLF